jgi:hypothetical protein
MTAPHAAAQRTHPTAVWILVVVGAVLIAVASLAVWARTAALDTNRWTDQSGQLLESQNVRTALATNIVDQIFADGSVAVRLHDQLPPNLKPLAAPIASGLQQGAYRVVAVALTRPRVQALWRTANRQAHQELVAVMEGRSKQVKLQGDEVVLDLGALVGTMALRLGLPAAAADRIEARAKPVVLVKAKQLSLAQHLYRALKWASFVLGLLGFALWGFAIYLAHGRRRLIVRRISTSLVVVGVALLALRSIVGNSAIDSLVASQTLRPAAHDGWEIFTASLRDIAWIGVALGVAGLVWAWATGLGSRAVDLRRRAGPYVAEHAFLVHAGVALVVLALIAWGPLQNVLRLGAIAIVIALMFWGVELWRRQAAQTVAVREPVSDALDRLATLHAEGALTDEEHAAARARLQSP